MNDQAIRGFRKNIDRLANYLIYTGQGRPRSAYFRYSIPVVLVFLFTIIKIIFNSEIGLNTPYLMYFGIVCLSAILGGIGPASMAAVISALVAEYYFVNPNGHMNFSADDLFKTGLFLVECGLIILLSYGITVAYRQVNQNQLLFRSMIEKGSEGIIMINGDGKTVYSSPSIQKIIGYSAEEFLAMKPLVLMHQDELETVRLKIRELIKFPNESLSFVHRMKHKEGHWIWVEDTVTNLLEEPSISALICNFYNVTGRVMLERQREDFIGIASHELKTPVTTLRLLVQLLIKQLTGKADDKTITFLQKIDFQVNRMTELLGELLDTTQLKQGQLQFKKQEVHLNAVIKDTIENIQITNSSHQLVFNPGEIGHVTGDKDRLTQVINNLIINGIKYSPEADKVIITTTRQDQQVRVAVQDFGIGISHEDGEKVFGRFYRATNDKTQRQTGLGLGLFISSEIIQKHDGKMGVDSEPGSGSTFWFTLPAA